MFDRGRESKDSLMRLSKLLDPLNDEKVSLLIGC